jgi:hypothetical protein
MVSEGKMPPGKRLSTEDIAAVRTWITAGATWPAPHAPQSATQRAGLDWWSLGPITRPAVPKIRNPQSAIRNPIDAFILSALRKRGLRPAPPADRETLIRRVTFDLIGLPPTPEEIGAFVRDASPRAYEQLIDRLLASPHYGERWGRHWLDVARYGESQGFEYDRIRDHAWRYRDYVIRSFNADKPYTEFIQEQIAGDAQGTRAYAAGCVATGFLVAGPSDEAAKISPSPAVRSRARDEELEEMIGLVSQTFLGLTVNCARCHDHKFDPIPQRDYYRLRAALEGVQPGDRVLLSPSEMQARQERAAGLKKQIADLERRVGEIDRAAREMLLSNSRRLGQGIPKPYLTWAFERPSGITLSGGASVQGGRLRLPGGQGLAYSPPLGKEIREKTFEVWVALSNLTQRAGSVVALDTGGGRQFDGIVFGERQPGKWIAGSDYFRRTRDLDAPQESARPNELVHIAATYHADGRVSLYRNGKPYGVPYVNPGPEGVLKGYPAGETRVVFGGRHMGAAERLAGEIEEARLYDRALSPEEVAASYQAGFANFTPEELDRATPADKRKERDGLLAEAGRLDAEVRDLEDPPKAYAANSVKPPPTYVLFRGDPESRGDQVGAAGLSAVRTCPSDLDIPMDAPEGERRLRLVKWIANPANPLTARVMVNRVWQYHFGTGIVGTPNDFGFNGERPTNPALLDWLASDFMANGWRLKRLHKVILLSSTYRQSSRYDTKAAKVDSEARLLWRFPPRRLEGEAVRDAMLAVSGQLNAKIGGPSFRPFTEEKFNSSFYKLIDSAAPEFNRRTVYRINVQSAKSPLLNALDCPDPATKTPRRTVTTTPLQALELMNNRFVLRQAKHFAQRVKTSAGSDVQAQVRLAYRLAFGREPSKQEQAQATSFVRGNGVEELCWALFNASEFLYVR